MHNLVTTYKPISNVKKDNDPQANTNDIITNLQERMSGEKNWMTLADSFYGYGRTNY